MDLAAASLDLLFKIEERTLGFSDGEFEGYLQPTLDEIDEALLHGQVILDANVLLGLYSFPAPAPELALQGFATLGDRLWVPHQAIREFWRNRPGRLLDLRKRPNPVASLRNGVANVLNNLTPTSSPVEFIQTLKESINAQLDELQNQIDEAAGTPLDWRRALANPADDPIIRSLEERIT